MGLVIEARSSRKGPYEKYQIPPALFKGYITLRFESLAPDPRKISILYNGSVIEEVGN